MADRPNRFDDWLRQEFAASGAFTALIVLLSIDETTARPLRSSYVHVIGDSLCWSDMAALLNQPGGDWDAVLFAPRTDGAGGGPLGDAEARLALRDQMQAIIADRSRLNQDHFFDRKGRRLRIDEVGMQ